MFGLLSLLYSFVFFLNAIVILNEKRFLNRICLPLKGEHRSQLSPTSRKLVEIITTMRTLFEIPLIAINIFFILYELLLG